MDGREKEKASRDARQAQAWHWVSRAFGPRLAMDPQERARRFFEEACELAQSAGLAEEDAAALLKRAYARPVGGLEGEIGGVQVALLILCEFFEISAADAEAVEFERVLKLPLDKLRQKQESKKQDGVGGSCDDPLPT
jgi:hypothetical protein